MTGWMELPIYEIKVHNAAVTANAPLTHWQH